MEDFEKAGLTFKKIENSKLGKFNEHKSWLEALSTKIEELNDKNMPACPSSEDLGE